METGRLFKYVDMTTRYGHGQHHQETFEVPKGKWVAEFSIERCTTPAEYRYPVHPPVRDSELIGITSKQWERKPLVHHGHRTAVNGWMQTDTYLAISDRPFAVVRCSLVTVKAVRLVLTPARQIHKGELGRFPEIKKMPDVTHGSWYSWRKGAHKTTSWVRWCDVAKCVGEADLQKLWKTSMLFAPYEFRVCYEDTGANGQIFVENCWFEGVEIKMGHFRDEPFDGSSYEEKVRRMPQHEAKIRQFQNNRREDHEQHRAAMRERRKLGCMLFDDPILNLEQINVPVDFAKSVLYAHQFGYQPDFTRDQAAVAAYWARP